MPGLAPLRDRAESCNHALVGNGETPPKDGVSYPSTDPRQYIDLTSTVHGAIRRVISSPEPGRTLVTGVPRQDFLKERGELTVPPPTPSERLLETYCHHLGRVRGLAPSRIRQHWSYCAQFLRYLRYDVNVQCPSGVSIGVLDVSAGLKRALPHI